MAESTEVQGASAAPPAKEKISVRHGLIIITGIMLSFGCSALCFSTWGLFQPVVAEGLGVDTTAFALYVTIMYLTMTIVSPTVGKMLEKWDVRIILSVSACLVGGAFALMSISYAIWMFYLAAVMLGLGEISLFWLAIPTLINRWFADRMGTFIGLCMAFTGIGGAVWSAVFTALQGQGMDFHAIYQVWAVLALVTSLPFTLFCVRDRPQDVGLVPYGAVVAANREVPKPTGLSASFAMKTPAFYAVCIFAGLINLALIISQQFPSYARSLTGVPYDVMVVGGLMLSAAMIGQAIFKLVLGAVADRNARAAIIFAFVCGVAGILLCWFGTSSQYLLYSGSFIFGAFYATAVVLVPIVVRQSFGSRDYGIIYSRVSAVFNFLAAFASLLWAWMSSSFGFNVMFIVGLIMIALVLLLGLFTMSNAEKYKDQWTE